MNDALSGSDVWLLRSERWFGHLLDLYPEEHQTYRQVLFDNFAIHCRRAWSERGGWGLVSLWITTLWSMLVGAPFHNRRVPGLLRALQKRSWLLIVRAIRSVFGHPLGLVATAFTMIIVAVVPFAAEEARSPAPENAALAQAQPGAAGKPAALQRLAVTPAAPAARPAQPASLPLRAVPRQAPADPALAPQMADSLPAHPPLAKPLPTAPAATNAVRPRVTAGREPSPIHDGRVPALTADTETPLPTARPTSTPYPPSTSTPSPRLGRSPTSLPASQVVLPPSAVSSPSTTPAPTPIPSPASTPTPAPSLTAAPSQTPSPSATAGPAPPTATTCLTAAAQPLDIVLVIDRSGSMESSGKLSSARQAARAFLELLGRDDRVGLISFNENARLATPLGGSREDIAAAIAKLTAGGGTRIDRALALTTAALTGPAHRPAAQRVAVLLSDGLAKGRDDEAKAAAGEARRAGIRLFAIGVGEADAELLEAVASSPSDYYYAPSPQDLTRLYTTIGQLIHACTPVIAMPPTPTPTSTSIADDSHPPTSAGNPGHLVYLPAMRR